MATKFFLRTTSQRVYSGANIVCGETYTPGSTISGLLLTAGASLTTGTRGTVAGTLTCSSINLPPVASMMWLTNPLRAVTISGTITNNFWMSESSMNANVQPKTWVGHYTSGGVLKTGILGCSRCDTTDRGSNSAQGSELGTARAARNWTSTPTSTTLNNGDRIALIIYGFDAPGTTMATGFTFDIGYNAGTGGSDGDSWIQFNETVEELPAFANPTNFQDPGLFAKRIYRDWRDSVYRRPPLVLA